MNTLTCLFRTTLLTAVGLIAIGALLSPQSARAQGNVVGVSATGAEAQTGAGATATGTGALAAGPNANASGLGAIAIGVDSNNGGVSATASGIGSLAIGSDTQSGIGPTASGDLSIAIGDQAFASGTNSVAMGANASATATNALALGSGASAGFTNSTAIGAGATTTRANQMSFGTGSSTYTMAGITSAASSGAQTGPTQFVTTDLNGNLASFNLQPVLGRLRNRIENTRSQEQGGIALALATANLRYDDQPGKISVAGGLGGFQHEGGGSLGLGYTAPNQRVRFNFSAGGSTHGDFGGGGGLSLTLN
jgi:hypothetical protein